MSESISIVYRVPGKPNTVLTFDSAKHSVWDVLAWLDKRMFAGVDRSAADARFERVMARLKAKK